MVETRLAELLSERGLTQRKLVELTGLRPQAISRMVTNRIDRIELSHIERVMDALEIESFDEFFKKD